MPTIAVPAPSPTPAPASVPSSATKAVSATKAAPRTVHEKTDAYEFTYQYPAAAAALPALVAWLDSDRKAAQAELVKNTNGERTRALREGSEPFLPFTIESQWEVVTELPDWLSLSATSTSYMGGAHPSHDSNSLVWDKAAQRARAPMALFVSEAALDQAVQPALCNSLDRERASRRGGSPVVRDPSDPSTACIAAKSATLLLGSSNRRAFNRIGFLFAPYVAGSYVEGGYDVTLLVTPAVIGAVRPEFRSAFAVAHRRAAP